MSFFHLLKQQKKIEKKLRDMDKELMTLDYDSETFFAKTKEIQEYRKESGLDKIEECIRQKMIRYNLVMIVFLIIVRFLGMIFSVPSPFQEFILFVYVLFSVVWGLINLRVLFDCHIIYFVKLLVGCCVVDLIVVIEILSLSGAISPIFLACVYTVVMFLCAFNLYRYAIKIEPPAVAIAQQKLKLSVMMLVLLMVIQFIFPMIKSYI